MARTTTPRNSRKTGKTRTKRANRPNRKRATANRRARTARRRASPASPRRTARTPRLRRTAGPGQGSRGEAEWDDYMGWSGASAWTRAGRGGSGSKPAARRRRTLGPARKRPTGRRARFDVRGPSRRLGRIPDTSRIWHTEGKDAVALLKADHRRIKALLEHLTDRQGAGQRRELFDACENEILLHSRLEEEVFYPAFRAACTEAGERRMFFEAAEEHDWVERVLDGLRGDDAATDRYAARCKVLMDQVLHHAQEEEDELLPTARRLLGRQRLLELGQEMQQRRLALAKGGTQPMRRTLPSRISQMFGAQPIAETFDR